MGLLNELEMGLCGVILAQPIQLYPILKFSSYVSDSVFVSIPKGGKCSNEHQIESANQNRNFYGF